MAKQAKSRKCLMCRNDFNKDELLRFVINQDNQLLFDVYSKAPARGMYVCTDEKCLEKALSKQVLFKMNKLKQQNNFIQEMQSGLLSQIKSAIPLLKKANMITFGSDNAMQLIKSGKAEFIMLAEDISENSLLKINHLTEKHNVKTINIMNKQTFEDFTNIANCSIIALKNCKLSKNIEKSANIYKSLKKYEK